MAIDLRTLGSKLSKYRGQLKESIIGCASSTGIDADRLASIEAGRAEPSGDEVLILADHYRCDFKFFISNERVAPFEQTETLIARMATTSPKRIAALSKTSSTCVRQRIS